MDIDIYIGLKGQNHKNYSQKGVFKSNVVDELRDASIRRGINIIQENTECKSIPVKTPVIICPPNVTIKSEHNLEIGNPVQVLKILYGIYLFDSSKEYPPNSTSLSLDIIDYHNNYSITKLLPITPIQVDSSTKVNTSLHVFRIPILETITIFDATDLDITRAFTVVSDSLYKYYYSTKAIAPSTLNYTINK